MPWLLIVFAAGASAGAVAAVLWALAIRRRQEAASRALREQEQNALVGTIASGLAHEIRNPLSTLRMNLQLLREDWESPITERETRGRKKIDVLLRETERLENVLSDFLRFASGHALRLERTDLNALAGELLDFLAPRAERANIRLRRELAPHLPPVDVDANLLRQAILNLLVNAQDAMPSGGEITLRTTSNGHAVRISVEDNGPGVPPENRDRIFNIYFSTKPGGTGLGLPMVRKIVEEHRGTVELESAPGKGSTFTICLKKSGS